MPSTVALFCFLVFTWTVASSTSLGSSVPFHLIFQISQMLWVCKHAILMARNCTENSSSDFSPVHNFRKKKQNNAVSAMCGCVCVRKRESEWVSEWVSQSVSQVYICVSICGCVGERERESVCVCVCVNVYIFLLLNRKISFSADTSFIPSRLHCLESFSNKTQPQISVVSPYSLQNKGCARTHNTTSDQRTIGVILGLVYEGMPKWFAPCTIRTGELVLNTSFTERTN